MNDTCLREPNRLEALLADRATQGLSGGEQTELTTLLASEPDDMAWAFDYAAAAVDLPVLLASREPLPAPVRARVEVDAVAWLAEAKGLSVVRPPDATRGSAARPRPAPASTPVRTPTVWLPWLAAAAGLALALIAWWPGAVPGNAANGFAAQLADLRADTTTRVVAWNDVAALGVRGEVVWNDRTQSGFMIFDGLDPNDPRSMQYQLWIFDKGRVAYSSHIAVDGGVFDVDRASGRIVVPIAPKLEVFEPALFAVTTEPPGGVVEHNPELDPERYRIILTADPGAA